MLKKTKRIYQCYECGLLYIDASLAKRCEEWCKRHKSCNLEITKHATKVFKFRTIKNDKRR